MLSRLYIRNFALIESLDMRLGEGLNILTGETGAGKSLLLGAIGLILGKRVDYSFIFNPEEKCIVEAEFVGIPLGTVNELRKYEDFDLEGDQIVLRREASANGKSRAFVNDTPVSLQVIKEVTSLLVDLHGQHENQRLLEADQQVSLLDQFAGNMDLVKEFGRHWQRCNELTKQISALEQEDLQAKQQHEFITFQLQELQNLTLTDEAEQSLEQELGLLQHAEEIKEALTESTGKLYEEDNSAYGILAETLKLLQQASSINPSIRAQQLRLEEAIDLVRDVTRQLGHIADNIDTDPQSLAKLQSEYDLLNKLKLKHGKKTASELGELRSIWQQQVKRVSSLGDEIIRTQQQLELQWAELAECGLNIEQKRLLAAPLIQDSVNKMLEEVGLEHARFQVDVKRSIHPDGPLTVEGKPTRVSSNGINQIEFMIRTNQGMPMGALNQTASGGEISRVMLAIKAALASKAELSVLIFDEIDTGISGATAQKVGKVMQKLSNQYQVIAITHLPQIASKGHQHFRIFKEIANGKTHSDVVKLLPNERVTEIARMLSGEEPTHAALQNAQELLKDIQS